MNLDARSEKEVLKDLEEICKSQGFIHVLAALVFENNFHSVSIEETYPKIQDQYDDAKLIRNELTVLHGLMIKHGIDTTPLSPDEIAETKARLYPLMEELHGSFYTDMIRDGSFLDDKNGPMSHPDIIREAVFYAADSAFFFQQHVFAVDRYTKDNDWLEQNFGFKIEDAARISQALILNTHINAQAIQMGMFGEKGAENFLDIFSISIDGLCEMTSLSEETIRGFIDAFSVGDEPCNHAYTSVDDYNMAKSHPLLVLDDSKVCLLQSHSLCESLYVSPIFWMLQDKGYRTEASEHRGQHLEEQTTAFFERAFGSERVYTNVELYRGKKRVGEIDTLVLFSDRAIVVQAKAKTLTLRAQQGDLAVVKDDFGKAIQNAYNQGFSCSREMLKGGLIAKTAKGEPVDISSNLKEIFPLCIVVDHYPSLYFQARQFLKTNTHKKIKPPYIMDLFFLDVLTEFLTHPIRLLDYLNKRTQYNESVSANNDFAVLGYHLSHNLYKDAEHHMMMLHDDIGYQLDKAFVARRTRGEDVIPEGVLTNFSGTPYGDLIEYIKNKDDKGVVDLGYILLSFDGVTIEGISDGIRKLRRAAIKDGKTHDLTMGGPEGGFTYHISQVPSGLRIEALKDHAETRKYSSKADIWFGLSATIGAGEPVDMVSVHAHRWKPNKALDKKLDSYFVKPVKLSGVKGALTVKLGRNDPCHCGSGKKYKKCCLPRDEEKQIESYKKKRR